MWDYPRPPDVVADTRRVEIYAGDRRIAESSRAKRLRETASPPTWYVPALDVDMDALHDTPGQSFCEWKGSARYVALSPGGEAVAWTYDDPAEPYRILEDHLAFYPARVNCYVDGERVRAQAGGFYGGWVTPDVVGPFKGEPGSEHW